MCLSVVEQLKGPDGTGYKVFENCGENRLDGPYRGSNYRLGETYSDSQYFSLSADNGHQYLTGYHIYSNLADARKYAQNYFKGVIIEVRYSNVTAVGQQLHRKRMLHVIVARDMTLVRRVPKREPRKKAAK